MTTFTDAPLRVYTTCPPSRNAAGDDYRRQVARVSRWSDEYGCEGILVYTDNGLVDPWLVAQQIIGATQRLSPLVAVQPVYMHPYAVAKMITSLGHLHGRRVDLNLVAGGFKNDLIALDDHTPHDRRYDRLVEYATIIGSLLSDESPVTFEGEFYRVTNLRLTPPLASSLAPEVLLSGSSDAGRAAADELGATPVQYPQPAEEYAVDAADVFGGGIRVGVIARENPAEAWRIARERFPEDRRGQITHKLAMKTSDSAWHKQLSGVDDDGGEENPYWMFPFKNYKTFCPYLVGSYDRVAAEIARYALAGCETVILDVPASEEDLEHTTVVLDRATKAAAT